MLTRLRAAGLIVPMIAALPVLALLLGLGIWQLQRKAWKEELIARIRERTTAPPVSIETVMGRLTATMAPDQDPGTDLEYTRVSAQGRFDHARELYGYAPDPRLGPGFLVYTPLVLGEQPCRRFVIVNRGYVPEALRAPDKRPKSLIGGAGQAKTEVVGLLRWPEKPQTFIPSNDPARNLWFWRDIKAMSEAMAPGGCPLPFIIDAEAEPATPGGWPRGGTTNLAIPNRHLEYAVTWFALAASLIGVVAVFAVGRWRATSGGVPDRRDRGP